MQAERVYVIVRCFNEMPHVQRTLDVLASSPWAHVIVFDSGSTDGSLDVVRRSNVELITAPPGTYVPGRVLNDAMRRSVGDVVAFVNADAVPMSARAVERLVEACEGGASASFGRQTPRAGASLATRLDYSRAFPTNPEGNGFRHFFSMAASAIRRDVWEALPFDEELRFSEDVDWTWRVRMIGGEIRYVPDAVFEHSHEYDVRSLWRRMYGEGKADAAIFRVGDPGFSRGFALPLAAQLARDLRSLAVGPRSATRRLIAQRARWRGRREGAGMPGVTEPRDCLSSSSAYTGSGDARVEQFVAATITRASECIRSRVCDKAEALLLLGGYARGEGSVEWCDGEPRIHNDVDLVLVAGSERAARDLRTLCGLLGREASAAAGATVDVWSTSISELENPRGKLLWADAGLRGVRVLWGDERIVAPLGRLTTRSVRRSELGRLLANRATGLALSRLAFEAGEEREGPRAARHIAKSWLALGDALLIAADCYERTAEMRLSSLRRLSAAGASWGRTLAEGYEKALRFRMAPHEHQVTRNELEEAVRLMWQSHAHLEACRLGETVHHDPWSYANARTPRFPELDDVSTAGRLVAGIRAARRHAVSWRQSVRHPREILSRVATLLAYAPELPSARSEAAVLLGCPQHDPARVARALEEIREYGA